MSKPPADTGAQPRSALADELLAAIAATRSGLPLDWVWQAGRGGVSGPGGEAYRECASAGLVHAGPRNLYLTESGARAIGLEPAPCSDPSGWDDGDAADLYLRGFCHVLAVALHRVYGHDIVAVLSGGMPLHVLVRDADGTLIDFDGPTTRERILSNCGVPGATLVPLGGEQAVTRLVGGHGRLAGYGEADVAMAVRYVDGRPDKYPPASPAPNP